MLILNDDPELGGMYSITCDENNIILNKGSVVKSGTREGEVSWTKIGYYPDLASLITAVKNREMRVIGFSDIKALQKELTSLIFMCFKNLEAQLVGSATQNVRKVLTPEDRYGD